MNRKKAARIMAECADLNDAWKGWSNDEGEIIWTNDEYQQALAIMLQSAPFTRKKRVEWKWLRDNAHILAGRGEQKTQAKLIKVLLTRYEERFPDKKPPVKSNQDLREMVNEALANAGQ